MSASGKAGLRLQVQQAGQGRPLLLIHGLGGSSQDWTPQIEHFSANRHVIAPDLRGFGGSSRRGPFTVRQFADDLWTWLDQREITQLDIVGHSMGAAVALQMALQRRKAIGRLVLSNTQPDFRPRDRRHYLMVISRLVLMSLMGPAWMGRRSAARLYPLPQQAALRAAVAARSAANGRRPYLLSLLNLSTWSVAAELKTLHMPLLVMMAEHDYFEPASQRRFIDKLPPQAQVECVAGAHHGLPLEMPEHFNRRVQIFLESA